jgi:hypothetical protein
MALAALATGGDIAAVEPPRRPPGAAPASWLHSIHLIHLWFLYYLVLFYACALVVRSAWSILFGRNERACAGIDAAVRVLIKAPWGPVILALPTASYYVQLERWSSWSGLPAPFSLVPDIGALLAYGSFFGLGWLLHRQLPLLTGFETRWAHHFALAVTAWVVCVVIGGSTPHWGPYLEGGALLAYTTSYVIGAWCWSFALLGLALRFLSRESQVRRYLADASYWLYLTHIPALFFFARVLNPLALHWSVKYSLTMFGAVIVLLLSYHYLVRFTFIGATLNGRRRPRDRTAAPQAAAIR